MHFPFLSTSDDNIRMGSQEGSLVASESDIFLTLLSAGHLFCFGGSSLRLGAIVSSPSYLSQKTLMLSSHVVCLLPKGTLARPAAASLWV